MPAKQTPSNPAQELQSAGLEVALQHGGKILVVRGKGHTVDFTLPTQRWRMRGSTQTHVGTAKLIELLGTKGEAT